MSREEFFALLKRKCSSLAFIVVTALAIAAAMCALYALALRLMPAETAANWQSWLAELFHDPQSVRAWLRAKGAASPWFFVGAQVLQVVFAPIPGQAVALAGGFVFGFWKGWALTTLGLAAGSLIAMLLARALGVQLVRRFVPQGVMKRFDSLIEEGGYTTFFMIFLLPVLPDDAVCFIAGLTKLKLLPLSAVRGLLRQGKYTQLPSVMLSHQREGMRTFAVAADELYAQRRITSEVRQRCRTDAGGGGL